MPICCHKIFFWLCIAIFNGMRGRYEKLSFLPIHINLSFGSFCLRIFISKSHKNKFEEHRNALRIFFLCWILEKFYFYCSSTPQKKNFSFYLKFHIRHAKILPHPRQIVICLWTKKKYFVDVRKKKFWMERSRTKKIENHDRHLRSEWKKKSFYWKIDWKVSLVLMEMMLLLCTRLCCCWNCII